MATDELLAEALQRFRRTLAEAAKHVDAQAMTLSTVDRDGRPRSRTMLIKRVDDRGFLFFTNSDSRKGHDLQDNRYAALCAYWQPLREQVTIEGPVTLVDDPTADAHWSARSRDSQLAAWVSPQSQPVDSREDILQRLQAVREQYREQQIPRPEHWIGYLLQPERIEFWTAGWHKLSQRVCYDLHEGAWRVTLLAP